MELNTIKDYIIKNYTDSCLAHNYPGNEEYYDECTEELIEECEKFFYYEKLHWCGCGCPDAAKKVVRDFLRIIDVIYKDETSDWKFTYESKKKLMKERFNVESVYDNELFLCLAYTMDAAGFTEHGSSIGSAWLSEEGKMFLYLLEQNKELDDESEE